MIHGGLAHDRPLHCVEGLWGGHWASTFLSKVFGSFPMFGKSMERAKGFEPSTPTLARLCSTPELRPLERLRSAAWMPQDRGEAGG